MTNLDSKVFGMISLGCDKNRVDAERLLGEIRKKGYQITDDIVEANILIVNTCAFLNEARKEAIETVIECDGYRKGRLEKLVVSGCLPEKYVGELFPTLTEADIFLGTGDSEVLLEAIERSYEEGRVNFVDKGHDQLGERVISTPLHYAYLKIADGCNNFCTYCLIPKIRGKYRSYPMESLIKEASALGDVELVLVAQDTTRYGIDLYGEKKLVSLIRELSLLENIQRIRLLYCYPEEIDDSLIEEIKNNPKVVKYLDIPFQHSEDRVLKLMNRRGSRSEYLKLIRKLREDIPDIAIRFTFIAGFPTETEEEVEGLSSFLREAKLTNCGFFAYSREPETAAYKLKGQILSAEKKKRVKKLYSVQSEISQEYLRSFIGKEIKVVCDGIDYKNKRFLGRAWFSAPEIDGKVYFFARNACQGETYSVIVTDADDYDLFAETEDFRK